MCNVSKEGTECSTVASAMLVRFWSELILFACAIAQGFSCVVVFFMTVKKRSHFQSELQLCEQAVPNITSCGH